jgi:hypothetical protein
MVVCQLQSCDSTSACASVTVLSARTRGTYRHWLNAPVQFRRCGIRGLAGPSSGVALAIRLRGLLIYFFLLLARPAMHAFQQFRVYTFL